MTKCRRCKQDLIVGQNWYKCQKIARINICRTCHNIIRKQWYRTKLKPILHNLKINGCSLCGYDKCIDCLEFHHINPKDRKFNISMYALVNKSNEDIINELDKCMLLCCNCHKEVEYEANENKTENNK